jgi:tetratricopeptide (TPR) repeat protein
LRGAALALRNADEALADLDASIERIGRQESEPLRQLRVDLLAGLKRNDQVEQELRALAKEFGRIVYFENLAVLYTSLGRLDAAEQVMRDAVAADPANVEAKVKLAQFQSRYRQQPAEAERTLKQFVADAPDNQQLLVYLGNFYEAGNRLDEARQTYEQAAEKGKKTSDGLNARNRLAALLIRAGQVPEALESLNDILEDEPDNLAALLARGEIHFAAGRSDEAVADFRGVLRREPENAVGLVLMARTHEARGDRPLAEDAYRRLLQAQPDNVEALTGLANLIGSAGQLDEAIKLFEQAAAAEPDSVAALAGLVAVRLEKGDLKDAEATARRFAALDDAQGTGQRELGRVLEAQGRLEEANQAFRKALLKKPDSSLALEGVVRTMQLRGQYPVATAFLTEHLEQYPDHVLARVLLGGNHLRAGQLVEARAALNQAIDQQPGLPRAYMVLAAAYPADPAARIKTYEQGIAANPTAGPLVQLLAGEHVAAGRPADAIKVYESQLDKDGMGPEVANNLAALLLDSREDAASHERALEIAQRFANSMSPMHLDTLGWAYYRTKDYPSAVRFLELAVAYGKSEPEARYHLAMAYLASDNATGARLELEKAVKEARPQAPWLAEARKTLASLSEKKAATG